MLISWDGVVFKKSHELKSFKIIHTIYSSVVLPLIKYCESCSVQVVNSYGGWKDHSRNVSLLHNSVMAIAAHIFCSFRCIFQVMTVFTIELISQLTVSSLVIDPRSCLSRLFVSWSRIGLAFLSERFFSLTYSSSCSVQFSCYVIFLTKGPTFECEDILFDFGSPRLEFLPLLFIVANIYNKAV